jgi:hypothetical protein
VLDLAEARALLDSIDVTRPDLNSALEKVE